MDASRVWIVWLWYAAIALDIIALPFGWVYLYKSPARIWLALIWIAIIGFKIWCIHSARAYRLFRVTSVVSVVALLLVPIGIFSAEFFTGWDVALVMILSMASALLLIPAFALSIAVFETQVLFWGMYILLLLIYSTMTFFTPSEVKA